MTPQELQRLLARPEGETLDFKRADYDFSTAEKRGEFIKDILSMANTPRDGDAHIVLGVGWCAATGSTVTGLTAPRDDATYQDVVSDNKVSPRPQFRYTPLILEDRPVGVISIPCQRGGPFTPTSDFPNLQAGAVYFRRGSTNARAVGEEQRQIYAWFADGNRDFQDPQSPPVWRDFLRSIGDFAPAMRYVLVADRISPDAAGPIESLGLVPWRAVIDFDPGSEGDGLHSRIADSLRSRRVIHRALANDLRVQPEPGIHWYFASGVADGAITDDGHRAWINRHKRALSNQLGALQAALSPAPIGVIVLWSHSPPARLRMLIEETHGAFGESCTVAVVGQDRPALEPVCEEADAYYFQMSLQGLNAGIASVFAALATGSAKAIEVPTASGAPLQLATEDYPWLSEDLEVVHLSSGLLGEDSPRPFRLGSIVSWRDLHLGHDCARDLTPQIRTQVEDDLRRRDTVRINLYHAPGGGGSTVARRIAWDLHARYPTAVLLKCDPRLTAERIGRISALTESSVLILVDGDKHSEREIDDLFEQLKAQQLRVVLLQVLRRFTPKREGRRQFWLPAELSDREADRFRIALASEAPNAAGALAKLTTTAGRTRSPFFFGLTAFGRDFRALPSYVAVRVSKLSAAQRQVIAFLSVAYYYGQQSLPAQSFATLLGLPAARPVILERLFQESSSAALELLIEEPNGEWRTVHNVIALEALQQIFVSGSTEDRAAVWRQSLSTWSKEFADFIRGDGPVVSERLLELARRVFVYRDNAELLGTERAASRKFSQLIEDIPSPQGRIDVLRHVSGRFPDEAHFHAHLGRLLGINGEFKLAVEEVERAIVLSPRDPVLHHMRGMTLRYQVRSLTEANHTVAADIMPLVVDAQRSFETARELRPDEEHSYVSEIQLLLQFLDFVARQQGGGVQALVSNPLSPSICRTALEQIETLLDRVSNLYVGETPSQYIIECRARLQRVYGDYGAALNSFDNLLSRPDVARPPIRRQIVWTLLRRHDGQWAKLSTREVNRARQLLEENLEEETRDSTSLRLWLRAIRLSAIKPSLDAVIERVAYWKANTGSPDAVYYLYVLHCLRAIEGSTQAVADMERALEECRALARYRRDRTRSLEWIGDGSGIAKLVHQSQFGGWRDDFHESAGLLTRVEGRVKSIDGPQKGTIAITGGFEAFFVPARSDIHAGRDENTLVTCYLGFSYDGPRAWAVERH